ncbi:unnamed protein product [Adineta steineri]|uniref:Leucine rich repeat protein n=1 Tax=Adineta steineri TaxID=433720 RepID=A0A813MBZ1_9BILA|nr:unnamed protein product [Adineta steineri]CAF0879541.1 unnamed protein product [Adineta steineri]CAF0890490.1 unnamed protein product [Adineta steineri]
MTSKARAKSTNINTPAGTNKKTDSAEPYHCKGKFLEDFEALCRQAQISFVVPVVPRARPPGTPMATSSASDAKDKAAPKAAKGAAANKEREAAMIQQQQQQQQNSEADAGESSREEPLPKTYSLRDHLEYFKPKIQLEMDNPDKQDTLTEIHIHAWKIDRPILDIFAQSFPTLERLHTLNFWHTGFTDDTLKQLATFLPKCPNIRTLILDANPIPLERYEVLLTDENSPIVNLSLRHCRITERGAASIAQGLGNERRQNKKLQTLNLAYNSIGDNGAESIACSLKFNRTLLVLNLSSNDISDNGAQKLSEVLSKFPLTQEELVYRRKLILFSSTNESGAGAHSARRGDRRTSFNSSPTGVSRKKSGLAAATLPAKSKGAAAATGGKADTKEAAKPVKKDDKAAKKTATIAESKPAKGGGGKATSDKMAKTLGNPKGANAGAGNRSATQSETDYYDEFNIGEGIPLLDQNAELIDDDLVLPGNRCLLSLNLTKNRISASGVQQFLQAVQYQEMFIKLNYSSRNSSSTGAPIIPSQGLLRLELQRNDFVTTECEAYDKIQTLLKNRREPIFKSKEPEETPTSGRDTAGASHSKTRAGGKH